MRALLKKFLHLHKEVLFTMDILLSIKVIMVGLLWIVGYYAFLGLLMLYFPIPQLYAVKNFLSRRASRRILRHEKNGMAVWEKSKWIIKWLGYITIFAILAFYGWSLCWFLEQQFKLDIQQDYPLFLAALAIPIPLQIIIVRHLLKHKPHSPMILGR
jgi:hypothetical protein